MKTTISLSVSEENANLLRKLGNMSAFINRMLDIVRKERLRKEMREGSLQFDEEDMTWMEDGLEEYLHCTDDH